MLHTGLFPSPTWTNYRLWLGVAVPWILINWKDYKLMDKLSPNVLPLLHRFWSRWSYEGKTLKVRLVKISYFALVLIFLMSHCSIDHNNSWSALPKRKFYLIISIESWASKYKKREKEDKECRKTIKGEKKFREVCGWRCVAGREWERSGDNEKEVTDGAAEEKPHMLAKLQGSQCAKHRLIVV